MNVIPDRKGGGGGIGEDGREWDEGEGEIFIFFKTVCMETPYLL